MLDTLASYRRCCARLQSNWPWFAARRKERLQQQERYGIAAEKVAENILEDLLTGALDWSLKDLNHQVGYADLLLTRLGVKSLILEVKRPGALAWNRQAVDAALNQGLRYAAEQKVRCVGISDGVMLYAADIANGGLRDRLFVSLEAEEPCRDLWWLSFDGIYRPREAGEEARLRLLPASALPSPGASGGPAASLLHPKYKLCAECFAYVGDAGSVSTWKLPYRLADGSIDGKRLPKAIQCILTNYRGATVAGIPEKAIPDVLVRLGCAAVTLGKMPHQAPATATVYQQLAQVLSQLGRLEEVKQHARVLQAAVQRGQQLPTAPARRPTDPPSLSR